MKKFLNIISSFSLCVSPTFLSTMACADGHFKALTSTASVSDLNILLAEPTTTNKWTYASTTTPKLLPVNFKYIKYQEGGYYYHTGYSTSLQSYKVNNGQITQAQYIQSLNEGSNFYDMLSQATGINANNTIEGNDVKYDFLGVNLQVENSFLDKIELVQLTSDIGLKISSTLSISVFSGYELTGTMLLAYNMNNENDYFTFSNGLFAQFINALCVNNNQIDAEIIPQDFNYQNFYVKGFLEPEKLQSYLQDAIANLGAQKLLNVILDDNTHSVYIQDAKNKNTYVTYVFL